MRRGHRGFVAYLRLPSFVMSLAMMAIARGLSLIISAGRPISLGDNGQGPMDFGAGFSNATDHCRPGTARRRSS